MSIPMEPQHELIDMRSIMNARRSIHVLGAIDEAMIGRLTPRLLRLRDDPTQPITVIIDSEGGEAFAAHTLIALLHNPDQLDRTAQIITIVTGRASSAAAELLVTGDHSAAFPHARIFFHGKQAVMDESISAEDARSLQDRLTRANLVSTNHMADRVFDRLFDTYFQVENEVRKLREEQAERLEKYEILHVEGALDLPAFIALIADRVSHPVRDLIRFCRHRLCTTAEVVGLVNDARFQRRMSRSPLHIGINRARRVEDKDELKQQLNVLHAVLLRRFDARRNWNLRDEDFGSLELEFELAMNSLDGFCRDELLEKWADHCDRFISPEDREWLDRTDDTDYDEMDVEGKERFSRLIEAPCDNIEPLWTFAEMLCRVLNSGEHPISPFDAWWLGLIDEVIGTELVRRPQFEFPEAIETEEVGLVPDPVI